jgi:tetraacyldisaccharide 4'-kinase
MICTEKDAVKLWREAPDALAVPLVCEPEPAFFSALDAKLSSPDGHQAA